MKRLEVPEFATYEDEAAFWDSLDTADFMEDDGAWFHFETPTKRAVRVAVLPDIAEALAQRARAQGVSVETLVNVLLAESVSKPVVAG
ncbi:MAG: hypothetical protein IAE85_05015 [Anaerolinea sp.]|nr:hypothetical protein [Anaerolinea sp.]